MTIGPAANDVLRAAEYQAAGNVPVDMLADATFRVVPGIFRQLLVLLVTVDDCALPAVLVPMTRKTTRLYGEVLREVARRLGFGPGTFMSDWETSLQRAARETWSGTNQHGC